MGSYAYRRLQLDLLLERPGAGEPTATRGSARPGDGAPRGRANRQYHRIPGIKNRVFGREETDLSSVDTLGEDDRPGDPGDLDLHRLTRLCIRNIHRVAVDLHHAITALREELRCHIHDSPLGRF